MDASNQGTKRRGTAKRKRRYKELSRLKATGEQTVWESTLLRGVGKEGRGTHQRRESYEDAPGNDDDFF